MASNFDWNSFSTLASQEEQQPVQEEESFEFESFEALPGSEPTPVKQSFGDQVKTVATETGKGLLRTGGRGLISGLAAPSKAIGGLLQFMSTIGDSELSGNQLFKKTGEWFQNIGEEGQKQLTSDLGDLLGESFGSGEEALSQFTEKFADIVGGLPLKGIALPAAAGAGASQVSKELGAPEEVQQVAELAGLFGPDVSKGLKTLAKKPKISKSGLELPKIVEETGQKLKGIKAKVFAGKKEKIYNEVSSKAEELITKIKHEKLPLSKQIEDGVDVSSRITKNLEEVQSLSNKMTNKIEATPISEYLEGIEKKIDFGGIPTEEQKSILKLADEFKSKFGEGPASKRFFTPGQYVKQFRNINKDLTRLYETKFVHGKRPETMNFYEGLKGKIKDTLESGTPESFSKLFNETNSEFSQLKRIENFENIIGAVTGESGALNAKKLDSYVKSPKKANVLKKQIGKEGFESLKLISSDLSKVQNKLKLVEEIGIRDVVKSATTLGVLKFIGMPLLKGPAIAGKALQLGRGYVLTSPQGTRDVTNFLRSVQSGNKKAILRSLTQLDKNAKEFEEAK